MSEPSYAYTRALDRLSSEIEGTVSIIREIIGHSGEIGAQVERAFHSALAKVLPERIGVSSGFVLDSNGGISPQLDIILYDRNGVPPIFQDGELAILPAEVVYAAGEVKTRLGPKELQDAFAKCHAFKSLDRSAQFLNEGPTKNMHRIYGEKMDRWFPQFFTLAVESSNTSTFHKMVAENIPETELYKMTMDTICCLNGPVKLFAKTDQIPGESEVLPNSVRFLGEPGYTWCTYESSRPWALFSMLLLSIATQYPSTRVNMIKYAGDTPL